MNSVLPPLRLTGALVLRDGVLQQRSIGMADGRLVQGAFPGLDLSGYYIFPGIVDLDHTGFLGHLERTADSDAAMSAIDREAASHGVTTRILSHPWSWDRPAHEPEAARIFAELLDNFRPLTDLRLRLTCETHLTGSRDDLLACVAKYRIGHVNFTSTAEAVSEQRRKDPVAYADWAARTGRARDALEFLVDGLLANAPTVPRHLCQLAEAFDWLGVAYGSRGEATAEIREHYSMIGARLCFDPSMARVAAAARAVGDPVVAQAPTAACLAEDRQTGGALELIEAGLCDALSSGEHSNSLIKSAFYLFDEIGLRLDRAWALVSEAPARIMRLPDRGSLAPGKRADLVIINQRTRQVEATISGGRPSFLTGEAGLRFLSIDLFTGIAAE